MKKFYIILIAVIAFFPSVVFASSASIGVSASNSVMVGNNVTVTVTLSSSSLIGSWEADLSYDKAYLQLTSSSAEGGGTYMVNVAQNGTKSKKYTFTFKALKSGTAKVSVSSYSLYDYTTMEKMSTTGSSKSISIRTKEEIEASYSSNAYLKSLSVGDYTLSPTFKKDVMSYDVEVENDVENIVLSASKEDGNASVSGTGEKTLVEGNNKFEIVVTAQKGNSLTYVVNVYRKELNPINVSVGNQDFSLIRKEENLPEYKTFTTKTIIYDGTEIPALYSEITGLTLVGVKDDAGNIYTYIYEDNKITNIYVELDNYAFSLLPLELKESSIFDGWEKRTIEISGSKVKAYVPSSDSKYAVIYAQNVENGDVNYYSYFLTDGSFQVYNKDITKTYDKRLNNYKYVIYGAVGIIILQFLIIIVRKPNKKKKKRDLVDKIDYHIDNEIKEEIESNKSVKNEISKSNKRIEKELNKKVELDEENEIKLVRDTKKD